MTHTIDFKLPKDVLYVIDKIRGAGYRADIVGGCVRDHLLGSDCSDYDVTTNATPDETAAVFAGHRIVKTGIKHGTVTLVLDDGQYEITTYRLDGEYTDNRHPDSVTFTDRLSLDCERRDFTMNAVCYNPYDGYSDFFGGIDDMRAGVIRAVGDPVRRFREDALRILRAVRFASVLGFTIESRTERALFDLSPLLVHVSGERIFAEWKKLLSGAHAYTVVEKYRDVLLHVIPGISDITGLSRSAFDGSDAVARGISLFPDAPTYAAAMKRLRTDRQTLTDGVAVLENIDLPMRTTRDRLLALRKLGADNARLLLRVGEIKGRFSSDDIHSLDRLLATDPVYKESQLAITGYDVMSAGISGKAVGATLSALVDAVIDGRVKNEREELLKTVAKTTRRA